MSDQSTESLDEAGEGQKKKKTTIARESSPQDSPLISQEVPDDIPEELLEALPEELRVAVVDIVRSKSFRGPLPPPEMLAEYEKALPGSA